MNWLDASDRYAKAAQIAFNDGDTVAGIVLLRGAAQCIQIHKNLELGEKGLVEYRDGKCRKAPQHG